MSENTPLAIAYYLNGLNFQSSAELLAKDLELDDRGTPKKVTAVPFFFLMSHAIELYLKAALLKRGFQEAQLKKFDYRHNLGELLSQLKDKGVVVTPETSSVIGGLHEQHKSHALRYTVLSDNGNKTYWPPIHLVIEAAKELFLLTRISTQGV